MACAMFGKTVVKTASGTIVAPTTCNDGDPYTKANDAACQAAGKTACWDEGSPSDTQFSPWVVGTRSFGSDVEFDDCFRVCAINNLCYLNTPTPSRAASYGCRLNGRSVGDPILDYMRERILMGMLVSACN